MNVQTESVKREPEPLSWFLRPIPSSALSTIHLTDSHGLSRNSGAIVTGSIAAREVMRIVSPGAVEVTGTDGVIGTIHEVRRGERL